MEYFNFEEVFKQECAQNDIQSNFNKEKFYQYMNLLLEWNEKINLTTIIEPQEFIVKHFVDSLTIAEFTNENYKIIDVGTGAGFPGIPLKLYNESLKITLIDSVRKKVNVLDDIIKKLNLKEIEAIHTRAEDLAKNIKYREKYDIAVSRAVSNMSTLAEYLLPFVKIGGIAICMKGPNFNEELEESVKAINVLGGKIEKIKSINIDKNLERNIIVIKKVKETNNKYPRSQGKALKEPIK